MPATVLESCSPKIYSSHSWQYMYKHWTQASNSQATLGSISNRFLWIFPLRWGTVPCPFALWMRGLAFPLMDDDEDDENNWALLACTPASRRAWIQRGHAGRQAAHQIWACSNWSLVQWPSMGSPMAHANSGMKTADCAPGGWPDLVLGQSAQTVNPSKPQPTSFCGRGPNERTVGICCCWCFCCGCEALPVVVIVDVLILRLPLLLLLLLAVMQCVHFEPPSPFFHWVLEYSLCGRFSRQTRQSLNSCWSADILVQ